MVALGSQIAFVGSSTTVEVKKRNESIIEVLKEMFLKREECEKDWRAPIK